MDDCMDDKIYGDSKSLSEAHVLLYQAKCLRAEGTLRGGIPVSRDTFIPNFIHTILH